MVPTRRWKRKLQTLLHAAGTHSWALYTQKKITYLRLFNLFMAERTTGQYYPLVQVEAGRFVLPARY